MNRAPSVAGTPMPIYRWLFPVPVVCFGGALVTDVAYTASEDLMWLHFSEWLIAAGLALGAVAAVALLVKFVSNRAIRRGPFGWSHLALFYAALFVELVNAFVHTVDGWTAVVPVGMTLSVIGTALALGAARFLFSVSRPSTAHPEAQA